MWKLQKATNLLTRLILTLVFVAQFSDVRTLSDKRLCADENCKGVISLGTGKINYRAGEEGMLSFKINAPIRIKSKSAGKDPSLWGIETGGREGYAPKQLIRETKIIISEKNLKYEVDVVKPGDGANPVLNTSENVVGQVDSVEVTTTKPLDMIPVESKDETIMRNPVENASTEIPAEATPVLMEMVDGTQIPVINDEADGIVENLNEDKKLQLSENQSKEADDDDDDDDEIGDYDDDDDVGEVDLETDDIETKIVPQPLRSDETQETKPDKVSDTIHVVSENTNIANEVKLSESTEPIPEINKIEENANVNPELISSSTENKDQVTTDSVPQSKILNDDIQLSNNKVLDNSENLTSGEILNEAEHTNKNQSINTQEEPAEKQEIDIENKNYFSTTTEQSDNGNPEIPVIEELIVTEQVNFPTDTTNTEENKINDNTKDALSTANNQGSIKNDNISNPEINQDIETNEIKFEGDLTQEKQEIIQEKIDEKLVSDLSSNIDKPTEQSNSQIIEAEVTKNDFSFNTEHIPEAPHIIQQTTETDKNPKNDILTQDFYLNNERTTETSEIKQQTVESHTIPQTEIPKQKDSFNPEHTTETPYIKEQTTESTIQIPQVPLEQQQLLGETTTLKEIPLAEQQITESATIPQEHQQQTTEFDLNAPTATQTDIPLNIESTHTDTVSSPSNLPPSILANDPYQQQQTNPESSTSSPLSSIPNNDPYQQQTDYVNPTPYNPYDDAPSNTPLPPQYEYINPNSPSPPSPSETTEIPQYDYYDQQPTGYAPSDYENDVTENPKDSNYDKSDEGYGSVEQLQPVVTPEPPKSVEEPKALPSLTPPIGEDIELKENKGLFATIMGTVNNMLSSNKKSKHDDHDHESDELHKILYPGKDEGHKIKNEADNVQYCEKLGPNGHCPHLDEKLFPQTENAVDCECSFTKSIFTADLSFDTFIQALSVKILEISELLAFLAIVAAASLFFIFGYYCFCNSSREGALLSKLNQLESSLLATHKENAILKHNLMATRQKLASIEDNSFGSNDMVVSLKKELEEELVEKARLQEQISNLQKELENAADAGIELNKIVSELLSNQTGDESIISSVEELQRQLNEQQNTILEINASLAEKSRENSELQLLIAEQNARYESEISNLQRDNDELDQEKGNLQSRLEEIRSDFDKDITAALEGKNFEIKRLQNEIVELTNKIDNEHTKWQTSMAKVEALEECLKNVKRDPNVNITQVIDVANIRAELLDGQRKYASLKERLEMELDSRKLAENQLEMVTAEVEKLKQDFNQSEKDKLEAQTRLEVLSNYFKEKETQLQKELSLKEAMWLKQQGETTTTVDRLTAMQEEIQSLKSQNDSLRAEIEAQVAAHKAQTGTLENRAHETWLAARQSDRRYEEARAEATALRRKLTALAGGNVNEANKPPAGSAGLGDELTNAPSPIHMESPGSPMLGRMPPPPFLPPPFMGPPPPFMGMPPPPPFVPPGEMRPAPLGRIMSPPPQRSGRFSPQHLDYEDYLDYEGNNTWHRHTYSPPPRTYRSLSPTDSRYNYGAERDLMSTYDTETDFSPPPSPRESRRRGGGGGGNGNERGNNNTRSPYNNSKKSNSGNKGPISSGSEKSYNSSPQHSSKTKGGGKSLV